MPVFNFLVISKQVLDGVILSPSKNKSLKYSPKLDKVFVNANQNPLSKKFRRFHLWSGLRSWKKNQFIRDFLFSKPINLGTSVRKTNRRSRNKERPKELRRKHYCSIKVRFINLNIFKCKVDSIRTQKALWRFVKSLILKVSNLAIISWITVFLWKCEINFY